MVLFAGPAWAAKVLHTRVGVHDEYTRIVFELDSAAGYQIERNAVEGGGEELIVTLDARAQSVNLPADKSKVVSSVEVSDAGENSVARIHLSSSRIRLKEMILANPPRIVLDVMPEQPPVAAKTPAAKVPTAVAAKAPAPVASKPPAAKPPAAKPPAAKPPAKPAMPVPDLTNDAADGAEVDLEEFAAAKAPAEVPGLADEPVADFAGRDAPAAPAPGSRTSLADSPASPQKLAMATPPTPSAAPAAGAVDSSRSEIRPLPRAPRKLPPIPAAAPPPAESEDGLFGMDMKTMGAAAVGLIGLVAAGVMLKRRRGRDDDMDDDLTGDDPFAGFDSPASDSRASASTSTVPIDVDDDDLPAPIHDDAPIAKGMAKPGLAAVSKFGVDEMSDFEAPTQAVTAIGGDDDDLFSTPAAAKASEPAATVVLNVPDMPGDDDDDSPSPSQTMSNFETVAKFGKPAATAAAATKASSSQNPEAARDVEELERRLAQTETRLDEALEAAERLERKVTAQTEELRVQRAAIARTQRAVRNLTRGEDESSATEPAPKGPAQ